MWIKDIKNQGHKGLRTWIEDIKDQGRGLRTLRIKD